MRTHEIQFGVDFETDKSIPLHVGRLYIGKDQQFVVRMFFNTEGALCLVLPEAAVKAGAVIIYPDLPTGPMGFPLA